MRRIICPSTTAVALAVAQVRMQSGGGGKKGYGQPSSGNQSQAPGNAGGKSGTGPGGMPSDFGRKPMQAPMFPDESPTIEGKPAAGGYEAMEFKDPKHTTDAVAGFGKKNSFGGPDDVMKPVNDFSFRKPKVRLEKKFGEYGHSTTMSKKAPGEATALVERANEATSRDQRKYARSRDVFGDRTVTLDRTYAGTADARKVTAWENIYWNYLRYFFTRETLVGKDRFGNRFTAKWYFLRNRHETRKCFRIDKNKQHQPYGALPTDSRLWEAWLRQWRHDPPGPEEEEHFRMKKKEKMGAHNVGDEEMEDTMIRTFAHTHQAPAMLQELDEEQQYNKFLINTDERRDVENNPGRELNATWTAAFVRGDLFYNEEEVEVMREGLAHMYRDREWQELEMKRQVRLKKQPWTVRKPQEGDDGPSAHDADGDPIAHHWDRLDQGVPFGTGVSELTTPELEKLRTECDQLEDQRVSIRKELGLTDVTDWREGRPAIDKYDGEGMFKPPPTSQRWKPKCWSESWGAGGGHVY